MNYEVFIIFNSNIKFRKIDHRIVNKKNQTFYENVDLFQYYFILNVPNAKVFYINYIAFLHFAYILDWSLSLGE